MELSLHEKIGQMIMTGFRGRELNQTMLDAIEKANVGNVILFSDNIGNARQARQLCIQIQDAVKRKTGIPAFIAIDQEGGMVSRMPFDGTIFPGNMGMAATCNPQNARAAGEITGKELHALGFNVNFAPVLDINTNPKNLEIGVRSYGDQPELIAEYGRATIQGLKAGGVMAVAKHFPGHGDTEVDSHFGLSSLNKTLEQLEKEAFVPFYSAIDAQVEGIMSVHAMFPKVEKEKIPATMSHTILTELLRKKLGFEGLIFTDCLEMGAIKEHYGTAEGAVAAILAGANIILISHTAPVAVETAQRIEEAVKSGEIPMELIDESVEKIMKYKEKYARYDIASTDFSVVGCKEDRAFSQWVYRQSVTAVRPTDWKIKRGERVLFIGCKADRATPVSDDIAKSFNFPAYLSEKLGGTGLLIPLDPKPEDLPELLNKASGFDTIVMGIYNAHINLGQMELINRLCDSHSRVLAVSLRNPYDISLLDSRIPAMAVYEYTPMSFDAIINILKGDAVPEGKLRVAM